MTSTSAGIAQRPLGDERAEGLLAPAGVIEVRLDVTDPRGVVEQPDRPLALDVERLALDLVQHAVDDQAPHAEGPVHRGVNAIRQRG